MENKKVTITIPTISIADAMHNSYINLKQALHNAFLFMQQEFISPARVSRRRLSNPLSSMGNKFRKFNSKKLLLAVVPLVLIAVIITVVVQAARSQSNVETVLPAVADQGNQAISSKPINKNYDFPLENAAGREIGTFSYEVQNAELRKEIIVKGQPATAVQGRVFLVINLKLKNNLTQGLQINTRDFIRLSVNGNTEELLAPDIHNDPVEVQAISTKYTRVGFAINESDQNIKLIVGEIDGDKDEISLTFN